MTNLTAFFYNTDMPIKELDIVLGADTDHFITYNKPYVVREVNGIDLITVMNDIGEIDIYSVEYFQKYNDEVIY